MDFERLEQALRELTDRGAIPAISAAIGKGGSLVFSRAFGTIRETGRAVDARTRFDIASITKILTGICFMQLVEAGAIRLDDPIARLFPKMGGRKPIEKDGQILSWTDGGRITWYQALTHTTGMGWARPKTRPSLPGLEAGLDAIFALPFVCAPGEHILYTDLPILLMGRAIELVLQAPLDQVVRERICAPLGLEQTGYLRRSQGPYPVENIAPTEYDAVFRNRRLWGAVHDENAYQLDGVAGHAGIFSTAEELCRLAMAYQSCLHEDGMLRQATVRQMIRQCEEEDGDRRGLIWQLSGRGDSAYTRFLSARAYGHAGFTGCFLWTDPDTETSIVLLSNDVYNGRDERVLFSHRETIMRLAVEGLQERPNPAP